MNSFTKRALALLLALPLVVALGCGDKKPGDKDKPKDGGKNGEKDPAKPDKSKTGDGEEDPFKPDPKTTTTGIKANGGTKSDGDVKKQKRLIVLENGHSPFWDTVHKGIDKAAAEFKVNAVFEPNDGTPEGQIQKLQQFATQASDIAAVAVSATDAANAAIADEMANLAKLGIKVINVDADLDRAQFRDRRFAFVGTDNVQAGEELGKAAKNLLSDGGGYVTFVGRVASQNAMDRSSGFKTGAGSKFKLLDNAGDENDRSRAEENVRNALINFPEVKALVGIWSYNAPAIVRVVDEKGNRDKVKILTFDAEAIAIEQMGEGKIDVMVVQNPFAMGYESVRLMKALVEDDKDTVKKILPNHGKDDGDLFNTGLKIVVPNDSPLKPEMFDKSTEFFKLDDFRKWLKDRDLESS